MLSDLYLEYINSYYNSVTEANYPSGNQVKDMISADIGTQCSTSLATREIKATMSYWYIHIRMATIREFSVYRDIGLLYTVVSFQPGAAIPKNSSKSHKWSAFPRVLQFMPRYMPPREMKMYVHKKACTPMSIAALQKQLYVYQTYE